LIRFIKLYIAGQIQRLFTAVTGISPVPNQSNLKHTEEVFYNRLTTTVTASWLEIEQTSYAVRHLRKLRRNIEKPPRFEAGIVAIFAVLLTIWQTLRSIAEPTALNWLLLVLCILLFLVSSFIGFVKATVYQLEVVIATEKLPLKIPCITRADLDDLRALCFAS